MGSLGGRRALVCGSTRGIGRACAVEFARLGARVTLLARDEAALRRTLDELPPPTGGKGGAAGEGGQGGHDFICADFRDPEAVRQTVAAHLESTGAYQILLNNTGGPPGGPVLPADPEEFRASFASHLICNHLLVRLLVPGMRGSGYGRIINIVSTSIKQPIKDLGVSNTIRGAVASWAKTLSFELAPDGITVNNVLPGSTETDRIRSLIQARARATGRSEEEVERALKAEIPMGRFARPEEIAAAAGFLATPAAGYITGVSLPVDGGRTSSL